MYKSSNTEADLEKSLAYKRARGKNKYFYTVRYILKHQYYMFKISQFS